ncbi:MATE family efflux transporter, partial [Faecalibacillus intestinalis]|uniref:MATE family efflux transporter n=2 Tax=Bacillota TaxID=1239 RepID=UPI0023590028
LIAIFGTIFSNKMLMVFGASQSTIGYAKDYMGIILIGAIFNIMSMMFSNLIRGDGNPKLSAAIMAAGCFMNI